MVASDSCVRFFSLRYTSLLDLGVVNFSRSKRLHPQRSADHKVQKPNQRLSLQRLGDQTIDSFKFQIIFM